MGEPGRQPDQDGDPKPLGEVERITGCVIHLLVVGRLDARDEREFRVQAGVLLVLRGVHRGVVGDVDDFPERSSGLFRRYSVISVEGVPG